VLRVKALQQAVVSASQFVLSSRKSASGGIRTQLDVLLAQVQEMQARRDLAQVRYMYLLARLRLSVLAGNPLPNCAADLNALLLSN
jgi:outer membrane protein TolC